jgi:hypothetical protein
MQRECNDITFEGFTISKRIKTKLVHTKSKIEDVDTHDLDDVNIIGLGWTNTD